MRVASICLGPLATNCYLIETDGATVLVDPAESSERLHAFVGDRSVDIVVLTHGHFDHIEGAWDFPGARVMIHAADLPFLDHARPDRPPIDRSLCEGDIIAQTLTVLHTPGHSPGSVVLHAAGALFVGDLLFAGSIGRTDLPGGSLHEMNQSLRRILELEGDLTVYPGHGEITTLEKERRENPFLTVVRSSD